MLNCFLTVTLAGGSSEDLCSFYQAGFESVYDDALANLINQLVADNDTIYSLDTQVPNAEYAPLIEEITLPWYSNNLDKLYPAFEIAASLTGTDADYIQSVAEGLIDYNPDGLERCLVEMLLRLVAVLREYSSEIEEAGQLLIDSQFNIGEARPELTTAEP